MNTDTDVPALPTDTRPTLPPPPAPAPSASFSLPNSTPLNFTSVNECNTQSTRHTLTPVAPSKRAAQNTFTNQASQPLDDDSSQMYSYLPKDIREIIEQRRRRERALHVRLSICLSVISNIESTLLVYKNDMEKEEADLVRNYLQQAIELLAASDNAPKSPPIPHQTKPLKSKSFSQGKDIIKNKALNLSSTTLKSHKESQYRKSIPEDHFDVNKI
ncbi:putative eka-like protein [Erysiphe necator]|uniref:Putative eka-like protein n=1 Tax=Uncinula necator TaxID=52586 RepID=A0A0B1P3X9_UNCNE|nr:putative eka-like protein [Erysiphe necator]